MNQAANNTAPMAARSLRWAGRPAVRPFGGLIDAVLVGDPVLFPFAGSISITAAEGVWQWVYRDLCPDLIDFETASTGQLAARDVEALLPQIMERIKDKLEYSAGDPEKERRLRAALGTMEAREAISKVVLALRSRTLLDKAMAFGRAVNTTADGAGLGGALQSMPLRDPPLAAMMFHAVMSEVANPTRIINAVVRIAGNSAESAVNRAGFAPIVEAGLAHAQDQIHFLQPSGAFADTDLICHALDRFHRLVRSLTGYIEFARGSRSALVLSGLTKEVSDRIEPRLREVVPDVNQALRRGREGGDRLDNDRVLAAINGVYLLATIRECRDSLALNAVFEQAWNQSGQALELHLQRNLDLVRQNPSDQIIRARMEAGIKMAQVRFNPEYAETLSRAWASAARSI